tara:strand:- start:2410 stop:2961 length:552 start_codon:yes stop_codon:yes gene_type:complete
MIRVREVNVISEDGQPLGTYPTREALDMAKEMEMDLVEVAPTAKPPVCRIMDYGKFKYRQSKKAHEAKKNQKIIHMKEVKFRPNTDDHDYEFKLKHVHRFLEHGDKAKVVIFFKGREVQHPEQGFKILAKIASASDDFGVIEQEAKKEGRTLVMILAPKATKRKPEKTVSGSADRKEPSISED